VALDSDYTDFGSSIVVTVCVLYFYLAITLAPNHACSGHGYAVGQRWWFLGEVASPTMVLGKHAAPLTLTLGGLGEEAESALKLTV
jgi:hypothetical protein